MSPRQRYLLLLAALLTFLTWMPLMSSRLPAAGTLDDLHAFPWLVVCSLRWLCLAFVLGNLLAKGDFGWLSRYGVVQAFVVLGAHALMGMVAAACVVELGRWADPMSPSLHLLAVLMVAGVPLLVVLLLAAGQRVHEPAAPPWTWRVLLVLCLLASGLTGVALNEHKRVVQEQIRREMRAGQAQRDAAAREGMDELLRLRPDDPLERWLPFARTNAIQTALQARTAIRARPGLTAELTALLRGPDESARRAALWYLKSNHEELPAELLVPVLEALEATAAAMRARVAMDPNLPADTFDEDCLVAAGLARENSGHAADFVEPLRRMQAVVAGQPAIPQGSDGQGALAAWLQRNGPSTSR